MPLTLFFFLRIALAIQGLLLFHTNFRIVISISVKNALKNLIGIALNLWMPLDNMDILTLLILSIHELGISFHLFESLVSFISVIVFTIQIFHLFG